MCDKLKKVIDLNLGISEFLNDRNPFKLFLQGVNFTFHLFQRFKLFVVLQVNGLLLQGFNLINNRRDFFIFVNLRLSAFEKSTSSVSEIIFARFLACCTMSFFE